MCCLFSTRSSSTLVVALVLVLVLAPVLVLVLVLVLIAGVLGSTRASARKK